MQGAPRGAVAPGRSFEGVVQQAKAARLLSAEHLTVDGTLLEAWASLKSFRPKGERARDRRPPDDPGNPTVNVHGEQRTNATHWSLTDLDALLTRKGSGKEAKLAFSLNVLMENRHGLCVDVSVARVTGYAEREEVLRMVRRQRANGIQVKTLGADKAYDTAAFVGALRAAGITPHVAEHTDPRRGSNLDGDRERAAVGCRALQAVVRRRAGGGFPARASTVSTERSRQGGHPTADRIDTRARGMYRW